MIKQLDKQTQDQILATQVYPSLNNVIKELLENSIDANPTAIEINLREGGLEQITVTDDGVGITKSQLTKQICKLSFSSKPNSLKGENETNLGLRGQALYALCIVSKMTIVSSVDGGVGNLVRFEYSDIISEEKQKARAKGTTITVEGLFKNIPVRETFIRSKAKKELHNIVNTIIAYCLVFPNIKFVLKNTTKKESALIFTQENSSMSKNIEQIFGKELLLSTIPFNETFELDNNKVFKINGVISNPKVGTKTKNIKFFFINKRHCNLPKVNKRYYY